MDDSPLRATVASIEAAEVLSLGIARALSRGCGDWRLSAPSSALPSRGGGAEAVTSAPEKSARERSAREEAAARIGVSEAAKTRGAVASEAGRAEGVASSGRACEFAARAVDGSRCGAAALRARSGETAAAMLDGARVAATAVLSSSDDPAPTSFAEEAMAIRPAVESGREEAGRDANVLEASLRASAETCADAMDGDRAAISERRALEAPSARCSEDTGRADGACCEAFGSDEAAARDATSTLSAIRPSASIAIGLDERIAASLAATSARDLASARGGATASVDSSDGACAATAGRQLMSSAGTVMKACICDGALLVASTEGASLESTPASSVVASVREARATTALLSSRSESSEAN